MATHPLPSPTPVIRKYWVSTRTFTVQVNVNKHGIIVWTGPILMRFQGQPFSRLEAWVKHNLLGCQIQPL